MNIQKIKPNTNNFVKTMIVMDDATYVNGDMGHDHIAVTETTPGDPNSLTVLTNNTIVTKKFLPNPALDILQNIAEAYSHEDGVCEGGQSVEIKKNVNCLISRVIINDHIDDKCDRILCALVFHDVHCEKTAGCNVPYCGMLMASVDEMLETSSDDTHTLKLNEEPPNKDGANEVNLLAYNWLKYKFG